MTKPKSNLLITSVIFLLFFTVNQSLFAQLGKTFWFVAPEVTSGHSDKPLVFRITTADQSANVTISMPANPSFSPVNLSIPPHTQKTYEVDKNVVENRPSDKVLNKGIYIESDNDITAYYEVIGEGYNPDKFTLKGDNALGTEFYIPSQDIYVNQNLNPIADEKADIVATEDNTSVTIIPSVDIVGHQAGVPFTIILNRGQTFSLEYTDISKYASMAGTYVTSDKPIAITISDDSIDDIEGQPGPYDLVGDQLIPTDVIGMEYIAVKTSTDSRTVNKVFILAIEDDTYVWLNNDNTLMKHLNKGDVVNFDITNNAIYIKSNKPVYAYQLASFWNRRGNELGSAILPSITCTGSEWVSFTRTFTDQFNIQLLTKRKNINSFILRDQNGNELNDLNKAKWEKVQGTDTGNPDETWYSTSMPLDITTGAPHMIINTNGLFQMSILDEHVGSVSYGYFSSYGTLRVSGLTEDCVGNKVQLTTTEPMKRYEWYSSFSEGSVLSNEPTLEVDKSGKYWVKAEVNFGGCVAVDTIDVTFFLPKVDLGPDTSECVGETITLKNKYPGQGTYQWSDNTTEESLDVTTSVNSVDNIWLEITDDRGCSNRDTVVVSALPQPELDLSHVPSGVCYGDTIFNKTTCTKYQWAVNGIENPADTMNYIVVKQSGTYTLTGWNEYGCSITESINVTSLSLPSFDISDKIECPDETETFTGPSGMTSYTWMNGASSKDITLTQPDTLWLEVKDNNGCVYRDSAVYSWYDKPMFQDVSDTSVCVTSDITLKVDAGLNNYQWLFYDGSTLTDLNNNSNVYTITNASSQVHEGDYIVNAADGNGCALSDTMSLDVIDVPALSLGDDRDICEGDTIQIEANPGYTKYNWFKDGVFFSTDQYILVAAPGAYELTAQMSNGCTNKDEVNVGVIESPKVTLPDDISLCPETPYTINIEDFTSPAGGGIDHLQWNTEETTQSITVQDSGTYSVLAFDNNGCFDYDSIKIEWYTLPEWALDDDTSFCDNSTMILQSPLSAPGDVNSYQWSKYVDGGADIPGPADSDWEIDSEGEYILTIKDKNNCISDDTVSVAELASPSIDLGDNKAACDGDTIVLSVDDQYEIYQWNGDPALDKPVLPVSTAGDNILTVWNNEGCSDADTVTVNFMPLPVVDLGDDIENCAGIESVLSAPPGMESYLWSTMDTTTSITVYEGNYWLKVKDPNGCANADTIDVIWHPVPEVTLGNDTNICPVDEIILDAGPGFASYEWQTGETTRTKVANFADTVNYVVVSNEYGCYGFDNTMVYLLPAPEYVVSNDTSVCSNDTLVLDAGSDYLIYNWFDGSNDRFYYVSSGGDYWVKVFDGCFWLDDTVKVISYEAPVIANIDTSVYSQIVIFPEGGTEPYQYAINDEPFQDENVYQNLENGLYQVYVKDANSCMDEDTVRLSGSGEVVVPNFFTPNGDGTNDTWQIKGIDKFPESEIRIYDRYGKLLVKYKGMEQGWDGRYLNKPLPSDDYWYVIRLVPIEKIIKGHVTLKR